MMIVKEHELIRLLILVSAIIESSSFEWPCAIDYGCIYDISIAKECGDTLDRFYFYSPYVYQPGTSCEEFTDTICNDIRGSSCPECHEAIMDAYNCGMYNVTNGLCSGIICNDEKTPTPTDPPDDNKDDGDCRHGLAAILAWIKDLFS